MPSLWLAIIPLLLGYLAIVRALRYKRIEAIKKKYGSKQLSYNEAADIVRAIHYYEHPYLCTLALSMALFMTYAILSTSKLLCATGQLTSPACVGRRAEDTVVLLTEALVHGLDSERGSTAVARSVCRDPMRCWLTSAVLESTGFTPDMAQESQTTRCSSLSLSSSLSRSASVSYTNGANLLLSNCKRGSYGIANLVSEWASKIYQIRLRN